MSVSSSYTVSLSVEHGLSPAFVWREGPQTVGDGCVERSRLDAEVQELQARAVELAVHWAKGGGGQLLCQLKRGEPITMSDWHRPPLTQHTHRLIHT